uniref:Cytochrome c oxidase subunit 8B n=1 Tax=Pygocentrus nattereri TaxID=42514 RepID=A0AAR2KQE0_PYGNA
IQHLIFSISTMNLNVKWCLSFLNITCILSSLVPPCVCPLQEQTFAMVVMFATILVPSGWILANLENYKKRP